MIFIFISMLFFSCEKEPNPKPIDPDPMDKIIQWNWDAEIKQYSNELQRNPVLYKDWVIVGFASDYQNRNIPALIAFNKFTGKEEWRYTHPVQNTDLLRNVVVFKEYILLKYADRITCIQADTRNQLWEILYHPNLASYHPMDIYGDYFYQAENYYDVPDDFPFNDSVSLVRYHIPTGQSEVLFAERMVKDSGKHPEYYPPVVYNDGSKELVIFTRHYLDVDDFHPVDIFAVDIKTKEVVWKNEAYSPLRSAWNTPPYIFDGNVIAASDWSMYSWNAATGNLHWKTELTGLNQKAGFSFSGPFLHGNRMYAISNEGKIFCVDSETGLLIWQNVKVGNEDNGPARGPCNRPIVVDDILFVNAWSDQALVLIDTKTGSQLERHKDAKYNGRNVLYDEETKTFFVTADEMLRAFTVKK
ncbi:MAG: PQQ-binding-like beta-propeller repeat protein [Saprospiraceae bacterium]|nr:PQQ-binding-like beta-propeller repeat protein [Saprospiraceae bacterium]